MKHTGPEKTQETVLTPRELEVAELMAHAYSYKMIAEALHISVRTVETHARNIHMKTGQHNVAGVISIMHALKRKNDGPA